MVLQSLYDILLYGCKYILCMIDWFHFNVYVHLPFALSCTIVAARDKTSKADSMMVVIQKQYESLVFVQF